MKEAKYNRGSTKLTTGTGHSIVLTKAWRDLPSPLIKTAEDTPGVDIRKKPTRGRPPATAATAPKVTHEEVNESIGTKDKA